MRRLLVLALVLPLTLFLADAPMASAGAGLPPTANGDTYSTSATLSVDAATGLLANDTDPEGDPLLAIKQSDPASGTLTAFDISGAFTYVPNTAFAGTDSFTYLVTDSEFNNSGVATVTISVIGLVPVEPDDPFPTASDDAYVTDEEATLTVAAPGVLANDIGPIGVLLETSIVSTTANGRLTLSPNGSFTYTPSTGFVGTDAFIYTAVAWSLGTSSRDATVTITVEPLPLLPTANDDAYMIEVDTVLTVAAPGILANDSDPTGAPLVVASVTTTVNGWLTLGTDGSFAYTPSPGFIGTDAFDYAAVRLPFGGEGGAGNATVTITVTGLPSPSADPSVEPSREPSVDPSAPGAPGSARPVPSSGDDEVDASDDPVPTVVPSARDTDATTTRRPVPETGRGGPTSLPNTGTGMAEPPSFSSVLALLLSLMGVMVGTTALMIRRG